MDNKHVNDSVDVTHEPFLNMKMLSHTLIMLHHTPQCVK